MLTTEFILIPKVVSAFLRLLSCVLHLHISFYKSVHCPGSTCTQTFLSSNCIMSVACLGRLHGRLASVPPQHDICLTVEPTITLTLSSLFSSFPLSTLVLGILKAELLFCCGVFLPIRTPHHAEFGASYVGR